MVLPPGAAIAGFAISVLGWYAMLRNGVSLIHKDVQDNKSADETLQLMLRDVNEQEQSLQEWKIQWYVLDHVPVSMFEKFWGQAAYQSIHERLEHMEHLFKNAKRKLSIFSNTDKAHGKNRKFIRAFAKGYLKLRFTFFERDDLLSLIENLSKELSNIQRLADTNWLRKRSLRNKVVNQTALYHTGIGHLLIIIAQNMDKDANALHDCCREAENRFDVELELNLFKHTSTPSISGIGPNSSSGAALRETRSAAIAAVHEKGCFVWSVLSQKSRSDNPAMRRLQVEPASDVPPDRSSNFVNALTEVMEDSGKKCHFSGSGVCFSIEKALIGVESDAEPRQCLRQLLSGNTPPNENFLGTISKFRLIFELSQACLVLLRTPWFTRHICSCAIQCCRSTSSSPEFTYEFRLKMGGTSHETPRSRDQHWCGALYNWSFPTKALRRLGLSLVEIVLGTQILWLDVDDNDFGGVIGMKLGSDNSGFWSWFYSTRVGLDEVLSRVQHRFDQSDNCVDAIRYCLTTAHDECLNEVSILETYEKVYKKVVEP